MNTYMQLFFISMCLWVDYLRKNILRNMLSNFCNKFLWNILVSFYYMIKLWTYKSFYFLLSYPIKALSVLNLSSNHLTFSSFVPFWETWEIAITGSIIKINLLHHLTWLLLTFLVTFKSTMWEYVFFYFDSSAHFYFRTFSGMS